MTFRRAGCIRVGHESTDGTTFASCAISARMIDVLHGCRLVSVVDADFAPERQLRSA